MRADKALLEAAYSILTQNQTISEAKYGTKPNAVRALDIIQKIEPGEEMADFLSGFAEWCSEAYGDLSRLRGKDNPLGSMVNLHAWKRLKDIAERMADLEWGDDPEEDEEEPMGEPSDETEESVEEDTTASSIPVHPRPFAKKRNKQTKAGRKILGEDSEESDVTVIHVEPPTNFYIDKDGNKYDDVQDANELDYSAHIQDGMGRDVLGRPYIDVVLRKGKQRWYGKENFTSIEDATKYALKQLNSGNVDRAEKSFRYWAGAAQ